MLPQIAGQAGIICTKEDLKVELMAREAAGLWLDDFDITSDTEYNREVVWNAIKAHIVDKKTRAYPSHCPGSMLLAPIPT